MQHSVNQSWRSLLRLPLLLLLVRSGSCSRQALIGCSSNANLIRVYLQLFQKCVLQIKLTVGDGKGAKAGAVFKGFTAGVEPQTMQTLLCGRANAHVFTYICNYGRRTQRRTDTVNHTRAHTYIHILLQSHRAILIILSRVARECNGRLTKSILTCHMQLQAAAANSQHMPHTDTHVTVVYMCMTIGSIKDACGSAWFGTLMSCTRIRSTIAFIQALQLALHGAPAAVAACNNQICILKVAHSRSTFDQK